MDTAATEEQPLPLVLTRAELAQHVKSDVLSQELAALKYSLAGGRDLVTDVQPGDYDAAVRNAYKAWRITRKVEIFFDKLVDDRAFAHVDAMKISASSARAQIERAMREEYDVEVMVRRLRMSLALARNAVSELDRQVNPDDDPAFP